MYDSRVRIVTMQHSIILLDHVACCNISACLRAARPDKVKCLIGVHIACLDKIAHDNDHAATLFT